MNTGTQRHTGIESSPLRGVLAEGWRFLRGRRRTVFALAAWSVLESLQTFLTGYGVARALDDGFLAGRSGIGLAWLAVAGVAALVGGIGVRGVFTGIAGLAEPLRDGLVRRAVARALARGVSDASATADQGVVSRVTHQSEMARDSFAGLLLTARSFIFTAFGAIGGLAALAPELLLVVLPPFVLGLALFLGTLTPMASVQRTFLDTDELLSTGVAAARSGLRDVVACGGEHAVGRPLERLVDEAERLAQRLARWAAVRSLALGAAGRLPVIALLATAPWLLDRGLTAGTLLGALTYLMQSLLPALHALMAALGAAGTRLLVVLERFGPDATRPVPVAAPQGERPPAGKGPDAAPAQRGGGAAKIPAVELRGVRFAYGPKALPVLDDLDLTVQQGEHLAVVGPSGIGKSTLTALLAGLLTPDRGSVLVAGSPAARHQGPVTGARSTLLPQEAYVFAGSIRENISYLRPAAERGQVSRTLDLLGLGPLVERLGGMDAVLRPGDLSQGERQLLALARAHLSAAELLLLDEATCHLDPVAEERVERELAARPGTLFVVAHRVSSAVRADRVLVLDGTRAVCGTHTELLESSALYRDLVGLWHPPQRRDVADGPLST
ncbi:ATP-binding cassette domain-containing protein [Streptomyces sp. NPDC006879]|uniref:ATP-binding cassette domain-containing protein n=1 Tax=Streptomyces sp. NPDC006879 TaxID=3364767 RepID=UPI0036BE3DA1